jgi:hypothetical protein
MLPRIFFWLLSTNLYLRRFRGTIIFPLKRNKFLSRSQIYHMKVEIPAIGSYLDTSLDLLFNSNSRGDAV